MTMANATRSLTTLPDELQLQICEAFLAGRKVNIIVAKEREVGDILQLTRYGLTQFSSNNNAAPLATSRQIQDVMSKLLRKDEKLFIFDASIIPVLACRDIAMVETKLREQITCVRTPEVRTLPYQQIIRLFPRLRRVEVGNDAAFNSEILATLKEIGQDRALVLLNASNDDIAHAVEAKVWDLLGISPPMHVEILVSVSIPTQALQDGNQFKFPGQNLIINILLGAKLKTYAKWFYTLHQPDVVAALSVNLGNCNVGQIALPKFPEVDYYEYVLKSEDYLVPS